MIYREQTSTLALFCKPNTRIYQYELRTDAEVSVGNYYGFLITRFKAEGNSCLISGKTLYLQRPLQSKVTVIPARDRYASQAHITVIFRCEVPLKSAKSFFNSLFVKIADHLNDCGDPQALSSLNESKLFHLQMFQGFWHSNVLSVKAQENGVYLKFDINHKLVCERSVYEFILQELKENCHRDRRDCLDIVKKSLVGKS
jgi:hypothetical protein